MLLQFTIQNFKSFRDRQVFSMLADADAEHAPGLVAELPVGRVLRAAALYGANASGKSTFVEAWNVLVTLVRDGVRPDQALPWFPSFFAADTENTELAFEAWAGGAHWAYGIVYNAHRVEEEWLVRYEGGDSKTWFHRAAGNERPLVEWGAASPSDRRAFLEHVAEGTRNEQPLLAELRERGVEEAASIATLILRLARGERLLRRSGDHLIVSPDELEALVYSLWFPEIKQELEARLRVLATGVERVRIVGAEGEVRGPTGHLGFAELMERVKAEQLHLEFAHQDGAGGEQWFRWSDLSTGTQRAARDASLWLLDVQVIDELDRSLHTSAARALVERHLARARGQLIFTTHDTNLLDGELLSPDAVWFVRKDGSGSSRLYSLLDFAPDDLETLRREGGLEEAYLEGRFGAVPFASSRARTQARWPETSAG